MNKHTALDTDTGHVYRRNSQNHRYTHAVVATLTNNSGGKSDTISWCGRADLASKRHAQMTKRAEAQVAHSIQWEAQWEASLTESELSHYGWRWATSEVRILEAEVA